MYFGATVCYASSDGPAPGDDSWPSVLVAKCVEACVRQRSMSMLRVCAAYPAAFQSRFLKCTPGTATSRGKPNPGVASFVLMTPTPGAPVRPVSTDTIVKLMASEVSSLKSRFS